MQNVLLITSDQQHYMTLGINNKEINTPNLDRLAAMGTNFTRAYCPNPTCTPTRASIITGQWPSQHGAYSLGTKLMEDVHTVGEDFLAAGYETALIGKAHFQPLHSTEEYESLEAYPTLQDLEFWGNYEKPFYGFKTYELARNHTNESHVGQHYLMWLKEKGCENWKDYFLKPTGDMDKNDMTRTWEIPEEYHYNKWIAERSCALLEEYSADKKPFFLWSSFFDPHPDYMVPEPWASMYDPDKITVPRAMPGEHNDSPEFIKLTQQQSDGFAEYRDKAENCLHGFHSHLQDKESLAKDIACYYGMVSMMDHYIGIILDKLEALGLIEDTLIVFTTDHGHFYGQHGLIKKGPFHYEDMIKIPFIAAWKGKIAEGGVNNTFQSLVDLAPTFLNACGIKVPQTMSGANQMESWTQQKAVRDCAMCENNHDPKAINLRTLVTEDYKITICQDSGFGELYDLKNDPGEIVNHWDDEEYKDIKMELYHKFVTEIMKMEVLPMPRIACA